MQRWSADMLRLWLRGTRYKVTKLHCQRKYRNSGVEAMLWRNVTPPSQSRWFCRNESLSCVSTLYCVIIGGRFGTVQGELTGRVYAVATQPTKTSGTKCSASQRSQPIFCCQEFDQYWSTANIMTYFYFCHLHCHQTQCQVLAAQGRLYVCCCS